MPDTTPSLPPTGEGLEPLADVYEVHYRAGGHLEDSQDLANWLNAAAVMIREDTVEAARLRQRLGIGELQQAAAVAALEDAAVTAANRHVTTLLADLGEPGRPKDWRRVALFLRARANRARGYRLARTDDPVVILLYPDPTRFEEPTDD